MAIFYRSIEEANLEDLIRHFNDAKKTREPDAIKVTGDNLHRYLLMIAKINPNIFAKHAKLLEELRRNHID